MRAFKMLMIALLTIGVAACSSKPKGPLKPGFPERWQLPYLVARTQYGVQGSLQSDGCWSRSTRGDCNHKQMSALALALPWPLSRLPRRVGASIATTDFGRNARAERDKQRNRLDEYNKILANKGCEPVNIDAEIERASASSDTQKKN